MVEVLNSKIRKAIKDHEDNAGVWVRESLSDIRCCGQLTFSELRAIANLKANNWKIKRGQVYQDNILKQDGELYRFRCIPEINKICIKLDMYCDC